MQETDLPERWRERIQRFVDEQRPGKSGLSATDFSRHLRLSFPDSSSADFQYAFAITHDDETAVFTEHCGYHIFPASGLELEPYDA